jgi:hypothetical protein
MTRRKWFVCLFPCLAVSSWKLYFFLVHFINIHKPCVFLFRSFVFLFATLIWCCLLLDWVFLWLLFILPVGNRNEKQWHATATAAAANTRTSLPAAAERFHPGLLTRGLSLVGDSGYIWVYTDTIIYPENILNWQFWEENDDWIWDFGGVLCSDKPIVPQHTRNLIFIGRTCMGHIFRILRGCQ